MAVTSQAFLEGKATTGWRAAAASRSVARATGAQLGLQPGLWVANVGAGGGYYARRVTQRIGTRSNLYAVHARLINTTA
ncbi:MAG: hypothetical protein NVSMB6_12010 [Burkholderiaceae bacterium]